MKTKLIIHPEEFNKRWVDLAVQNGIDALALHSVGNCEAHVNLARDLHLFESDQFKDAVDYAKELGLAVEYEIHVASYLLPRELFDEHPEYFRADQNGVRQRQSNFCASSEEGLKLMAQNAVALAKKLYGSSHDFYFWTDDIKGAYCQCEKCKRLTPSDQNLILMNAIIKELRREFPDARLAYLAYYDSVKPPVCVKPEEGIFLEYAPYERDLFKPASEGLALEVDGIKDLLEFFGKKNSCVLEYWLDNSYFSKYKKPPSKLTVNNASIKRDIAFYLDLGFENVSSFACFLGDDYVELYGEPDISSFKK